MNYHGFNYFSATEGLSSFGDVIRERRAKMSSLWEVRLVGIRTARLAGDIQPTGIW